MSEPAFASGTGPIAAEPKTGMMSAMGVAALYRGAAHLLATMRPAEQQRKAASLPLPQLVSPAQRRERVDELRRQRTRYVYASPESIPGVAFLEGTSKELAEERPSLVWVVKASAMVVLTLLNSAAAGASFAGVVRALRVAVDILFLQRRGEENLEATLQHVSDATDYGKAAGKLEAKAAADAEEKEFRKAQLFGSGFEEHSAALKPYREMYSLIARREISDVFLQDSVFARLRTAGFNPTSLFRVDDVSDSRTFSVDDARMPNAGDTLAAAAAERRLYALDFSEFSAIKQKVDKDPKRLIMPTKALFVLPPGKGTQKLLQPVAIEMPTALPDGTFDFPGSVVYPQEADGEFCTNWEIAKMTVNVCDAIHHELIAHLGRTHLLVEPFVVSTMRQLSSKHPLHKLLRPHFEGTLFINNFAAGKFVETGLVSPGGDVDQLFGGDIESVMKWCSQKVIENKFNAAMPDAEMAARGVDHGILDSPYREDALEHFAALNKWVSAYVHAFYLSDEDVVGDVELQQWVEELVDDDGGKVKDFGENGDGKVTTRKYLARALSFVIFSASVQHAAVNFPQSSLMSYAPAVAGAIWHDLPPTDKPASGTAWKNVLPPLEQSMKQLDLMTILGGVYHTRLGQYGRRDLPRDAPVLNALKEYQASLKALEVKIQKREKSQELPYEYLRPSRIPQSINV